MYILAQNMWFTSLIRQFFFSIDKIVFNFISSIYDVLIMIARTSILSQSDIVEMADRIYKLLAIFMVFKVTLSLITYVVNPDDFSDKSKGISKLSKNIIISLSLLILTPYIFSYAYQLQTIILEDNSLSVLIFGDDEAATGNESFFNTAGDKIAYVTIMPFFSPNLSLPVDGMINCDTLTKKESDLTKFNPDCKTALEGLINDDNDFSQQTLDTYVAGIENGNFSLTFRQDLVLATATDQEDDGETSYIMDYKFIFSTVVGVVIILLLITFCMDIAVRSIKLAFLQLAAPIPILSYVDPKSGKDGMFKKWYSMCFKTYLSLFIRLLALYFAVYIIGKVADLRLVDIIDGSYVTNGIVSVFIIIGALMFAKQLPKLLEGLGIKLDGDGKFTLNPLKKFEEGSIGGKNVTGALRGALVGAGGMLTGAGAGRAISGAWRGMTSGKGWKETGKAEAEMNRKMRQAKLDGSTFGGRMAAKFAGATGMASQSEMIARQKDKISTKQRDYDNNIKSLEDKITPTKTQIGKHEKFTNAVKSMEDRAKSEIENGNSWVGQEYKLRKKTEELMSDNIGKTVQKSWTQSDIDYAQYRLEKAEKDIKIAKEKGDAAAEARAEQSKAVAQQHLEQAKANIDKTLDFEVTSEEAAWASSMASDWLSDQGMKSYMTDATSGIIDDATFRNARANAETAGTAIGVSLSEDGGTIHSQFGKSKGEIGELQRSISADEDEIARIKDEKSKLGDELRDLEIRERKAKANESAIK